MYLCKGNSLPFFLSLSLTRTQIKGISIQVSNSPNSNSFERYYLDTFNRQNL